MAIHHQTLKAAAAQGIELTQAGLTIRAFCPRLGCELFGQGKARAALDEMQDLVWLRDHLDHEGLTYEVVPEGDGSDNDCSTMTLKVGDWSVDGHPSECRAAFRDRATASSSVEMETPEEAAEALGVAVEDMQETQVEEEDERLSGSVVGEKYRALYAEAGHPTHCGDEMAVWFDANTTNKGGTDLALFELICSLNGVDTSKYRRGGTGWAGRIRMTGRNMLARRVYLADGLMKLPEAMGGSKQFSAEWLASRKFANPKAAAAAAAAEPTVSPGAQIRHHDLVTTEVVIAEHLAAKRDRSRKGRGK